MTREIRLNAFFMNCVVHQSPGLWRHPRDRTRDYTNIDYWVDLARTLERGKFDALFLADVLGVYDVYGGSVDAALSGAVQVPANDPVLLVPALSYATSHIGFGVTSILSYDQPYAFARRMSTLDHLSKGRVGWNVVTGYLDSAARAAGRSRQNGHDLRYEIADEYMEVVYKLWEGSWEDGAVLRDREAGLFTDPKRVHRIRHEGRHFTLDGYHLSEPSPQRTPVLFQVGSSPRGRAFAARHAECVFIAGNSKTEIRKLVDEIRSLAKAAGRPPEAITVFLSAVSVPGWTRSEAENKLDDYRRYASVEGGLVLQSGWQGLDFASAPLEAAIGEVRRGSVEAHDRSDRAADRRTIQELGMATTLGGGAPLFLGSAAEIADEMQDWVEQADIDGFNLTSVVAPESYVDFVDIVAPELQRRGAYKRDYAKGTLREKLGGAARLATSHPAARHRVAEALV
ncbi:LLM class flavin-dependent oxidoreductase [Labrys okinawensis]|uniref:LLM class flavin-dependent oxidoreductase n=1 Tax=Labrys okinawensis TaxID=346911 RepID=UPI0039BD65E8